MQSESATSKGRIPGAAVAFAIVGMITCVGETESSESLEHGTPHSPRPSYNVNESRNRCMANNQNP